MNTLNLKIMGVLRGDTFVTVDGARVDSNSCAIQTEKTQVRVAVCRYIDVGGPLWFITQLLFFIVSIFGVFDVHAKRKYLVADCRIDVSLKEVSNLTIRINPPRKNAKVAEFVGDVWLAEWSNKYVADGKAKKIYLALNLIKVLLFLGGIVGLVALIMHFLGF